ncbi:histidine kinase [Photobacterium sp. SDRW27]|uniref:sensor histidine kinase n=1 Tax=Photobacterium obscurum TaxID=2829490 RepID=UPI002244C012|nr:histidine kinase [Photobacterium obscurum]MCW8329914.1 histidine kinase [Photobacterium obscurum]
MNILRFNLTARDICISICLCIGIALITFMIRGGEFSRHLIIAFGYGGICNAISLLIQYYWPSWRSSLHFFLVVGGTLFLGTLHAMMWSVWYPVQDGGNDFFSLVGFSLFFSTLIYYFFYNREKALLYESELRQARLTQAEQEKALVVSQLQVLQSQIEPHFLFNTLANLQVLIDADPNKAKQLLVRLTELLRISLKKSRREWIMLGDEIDLLDAYLGIQSMRLGDRLTYRLVIDDDVDKQWDIPPHMLQPLVENAVFHGIEPREEGGEVAVFISCHQERLLVEIKDNGVGFEGAPLQHGHGVSLDNIRQRLKALYGEKAYLSISAPESGGVTTRIELIPGEYLS